MYDGLSTLTRQRACQRACVFDKSKASAYAEPNVA